MHIILKLQAIIKNKPCDVKRYKKIRYKTLQKISRKLTHMVYTK